jgi:hypothetical protein
MKNISIFLKVTATLQAESCTKKKMCGTWFAVIAFISTKHDFFII